MNRSEWLRAEREGLVEPIDSTVVQKDKLLPDAVFANGISYCALGTNLCFRKDKFPNGGPEPSEWLGGASDYPLHLISSQPRYRLHSQTDAGPVSARGKVAGREAVALHPHDALKRGIKDGDVVRIYNSR